MKKVDVKKEARVVTKMIPDDKKLLEEYCKSIDMPVGVFIRKIVKKAIEENIFK